MRARLVTTPTVSAVPDAAVRRNLVLSASCLALVLVIAGVAMLNLALSAIAVDLGASQAQQQWIVDAYTVALAALLLPLGALGDRLGRRPLLLTGIAVLTVAAGLSAVAPSTSLLILWRAVSGVGAAMIMPATLATITAIFPVEERAKAIGVWAGFAVAGAVIGLLASGLLLEHYWWGSLFAATAGAGVAVFAASWALVPNTMDPAHAHLDPAGSLLSVLGVGAVVFGIIEGPERGWSDPLTAAGLVVGMTAIAAWALWALRTDRPLLDFRLFKIRSFAAGTVSLFTQFFAVFGLFLIAMQFLLLILGYSTLTASVALAPMGVVILPFAVLAGVLSRRYGQRTLGVTGLLVCAGGLAVLATMDAESGYWYFFAGFLAASVGIALAMTPATDAIVGSLPPAKQGVASAVNDVARELGAALGIAVMGSAFNSGYRANIGGALNWLPPDVANVATRAPAAGLVVAQKLGGAGRGLIVATRQAFMAGARGAFLIAAAILILGAAFVAWCAPRRGEDPEVTLHDALADATASHPQDAGRS